MSLGTTYFPTVTVGGATSYKPSQVLTYSNGYWEVYSRFQGDFLAGEGLRREGDVRGTFHPGICHGGRKFSRRELKIFYHY